ncbi:manganese-transporting ATPase 13A1 [Octopus sinensis]|uniref:Manganese-transporting ATPase 13A1 n=1 Tax=Octopus sinensis TaxID=2607531 RepID=A0A6P7TGM2_9MOLL|nr:manganese-transporting ATPase 13A1 [Octopus sinensis]
MANVNDEIKSLTYFNVRPVILRGFVGPFLILYICWFYLWIVVYGVEEYFDAGIIAVGIIVFVHTLTGLFCVWSVHVQCALTCTSVSDPFKASLIKVVPTPNNGSTELVTLNHVTLLPSGQPLDPNSSEASQENLKQVSLKKEAWFWFQKTKYVYSADEKKQFLPLNFPVDLSIKQFLEWKGYPDEVEIKAAEYKYGKNTMEMIVPKFMELFQERATAPFFIFQVFGVALWSLEEYWYYSLFTLIMLVAFEATLVQQQLRNMTEIRKMGNKPYIIQVYRNRRWRGIYSDELLPGDIVSIGRTQDEKLVPCDLLLLRGPCIVDESMLTGESVPVMKEPVENLTDHTHVFNIETDGQLHVLYGGTKVVQHSAPSKTAAGLKCDNMCIAYVLHHSFNTSQGKLLRTILYGTKHLTANNLETFFFILFLLFFAIIAAAYVWIYGTMDPDRNRYKLFLECAIILTSVVPPELPIELSLAVNTSLLALIKFNIYCTEPFRIPSAGKLDICCFDKTGTLTSDCLVVEGVAGLNGKKLVPTLSSPITTNQVLATCHSLVQMEDELIGDPLEKATLSAVEWKLTRNDAVIPTKIKTHGLKIFQRFHFSSALKRMSVIAGYSATAGETEYIATVKGAPETLKAMFQNPPKDYDEVYLAMARRGARVLALGHKTIGVLTHQQVRELTREAAECNLEFAGFVIISCPLKTDSHAVIKEIQQSSHHVVMITGDNPLTACHVAQELRITQSEHTLVLQPPNVHSDVWHWQSIDDTLIFNLGMENLRKLIKEHDLCITGQSISHLQTLDPILMKTLLPNVKVFARVAPKQKEFVITLFKDVGFITLMCGDGTNDVGALKHADVGVALVANGPERFPEKLDKKRSKKSENINTEGSATDRVQVPQTRGKCTSRIAKQRAINRGENLAYPEKKIANILKQMEEEEKAQVVRLGDASIAAPFSSKVSSAMSVCHIIKQGRCTLVTTLQMFKILALSALILAYSQSVLYLDGVKFSDSQQTIQGLLLAGCFLFNSRSKPLRTLSKERPLPNIFNIYTILTVLGQFVVHFTSLVYLVRDARVRSGYDEYRKVDLEAKFEPNLLNTTVYIISVTLQVSTFFVNYTGEPFMEGLKDNKPLLYSLLISGSTVLLLASGIFPQMLDMFQLVELPSDFCQTLVIVILLDMIGSFVIDKICHYFFGKGKVRKV